MKERLLQFLKTENKSSAQFAEEIGVQPSGISHILAGRNKPSLDFILKMLEKYKFLSVEWLLFGKGNMYKETEIQRTFDEPLDLKIENNTKTETNQPAKEKIEDGGSLLSEKISIKPDVEKIVWFFNDNSFKEYLPDR
jgi:transcriptional regulator with XRE-family HTH domain